MTTPTYGPSPVPPEDIIARIDELIPRDETTEVPLVWRARNVDAQMLIAARNEILRLRAGGCARDQRTTQHCVEAAAAHAESERLRAHVAVLEAALCAIFPQGAAINLIDSASAEKAKP